MSTNTVYIVNGETYYAIAHLIERHRWHVHLTDDNKESISLGEYPTLDDGWRAAEDFLDIKFDEHFDSNNDSSQEGVDGPLGKEEIK